MKKTPRRLRNNQDVPVIGVLQPEQIQKLSADLNKVLAKYFSTEDIRALLIVATRNGGLYGLGMNPEEAAKFAVKAGMEWSRASDERINLGEQEPRVHSLIKLEKE